MNFDPPLVASEEELQVNHGFKRQILATLIVSFGCLNGGLTIGWAQTGKIGLQNCSESTQDPDTQKGQINEVLKISLYSTMLAAAILCVLSRFFGRRIALLAASLVSVVMSVFLQATSGTPPAVWWLSGAVVIPGITFGPMLLSEAVHEDTRGALMSACVFQLNFGVFLALTVGSYLDPTAVSWCLLVLYAVQLFLLLLIPESPVFLAWKSNRLKAEGSLFWFSGNNRSIALAQVSKVANHFENNNKSVVATLKESEVKHALYLLWLQFVIFLVFYWILIEFRIEIHLSAKGHMSENSVDILVACVQAVASLLTAAFVDSVGRINLSLLSHLVNPIAMIISWVYFAWIWSPDGEDFCWFPVLISIMYTASFTVGVATYFSVHVNEMFPMPIKDVTSALAGFAVAATALTPVLCRNILDGYLGFGSDKQVFFSVANPIVIASIWIYAEETRGKSLLDLVTW